MAFTGCRLNDMGGSPPGTSPPNSAPPRTPISTLPDTSKTFSAKLGAPEAGNSYDIFAVRSSVAYGGVDEIWAQSRGGGSPRLIVRTKHWGATDNLAAGQPAPNVSPLQAAGNWLAWVEYQQHGSSPTFEWWDLRAYDDLTAQLSEVASWSGSPTELPQPSISSDGILVWDETSHSGRELRVFHLTTNESTVVQLPPSVSPVAPRVDGRTVVFLDNTTDSNRQNEVWISRGGALMSYNLDTNRLSRLWSEDDARQPLFATGYVAWYATVPDPRHPSDSSTVWQVRLSPLNGGSGRILGLVGASLLLSSSHVVWNDFQTNITYAYSFSTDRTSVVLATGMHQGSRLPLYALCGPFLYYYSWDTGETRVLNLET
jgi:hypothetical protein